MARAPIPILYATLSRSFDPDHLLRIGFPEVAPDHALGDGRACESEGCDGVGLLPRKRSIHVGPFRCRTRTHLKDLGR